MNAFFQKALDHVNFLLEHPLESLIVFFVSIIICTILINYLYSERISTLEERVKLKDDLIDFYKNINSELGKKLPYLNHTTAMKQSFNRGISKKTYERA